MRRTAVLVVVVALAAGLVLVLRAPVRRTGAQAARGTRVFRVPRQAVRGVDVTLGERRVAARRDAAGWKLDDRPASASLAAALDDLVLALVELRALDAFRPRESVSYGFDRPQGVIALATAARSVRLVLGEPNAAGSALYARRAGDPRVLQVGTGLLSSLERVFYRLETSSRLRPGDREVGLADAARAAAEVAQLLDQEERLVVVRPAEEDALLADRVDAHQALGVGREGVVRREPAAGVARAGAAEAPVGEDAVVPVAPQDAERVAADLAQLLDVGGLGRPRGHSQRLEDGRPGGNPSGWVI